MKELNKTTGSAFLFWFFQTAHISASDKEVRYAGTNNIFKRKALMAISDAARHSDQLHAAVNGRPIAFSKSRRGINQHDGRTGHLARVGPNANTRRKGVDAHWRRRFVYYGKVDKSIGTRATCSELRRKKTFFNASIQTFICREAFPVCQKNPSRMYLYY